MKTFHCDNCSAQVFFENTVCGNCGWMLGYQPQLQASASFSPLEPAVAPAPDAAAAVPEAGPGRWRSVRP
ncbi:zinc-ribbon domain-containing protein, partial [Acinetobacter baumannii]